MKKVKALDPHLQYPEVGPGEAADGRSPQSGEVSSRVQHESGGPAPRAPPADDQNVNPGQSFPGKFAGERRKEAFFRQRWIFISRARIFRPAPPAPADAARPRRPGVCDLAGNLGGCAESTGL